MKNNSNEVLYQVITMLNNLPRMLKARFYDVSFDIVRQGLDSQIDVLAMETQLANDLDLVCKTISDIRLLFAGVAKDTSPLEFLGGVTNE